jgi:hypothetical protein
MGKSGRTSVAKLLPRSSARSSVARVGLSQQLRRQTPARFEPNVVKEKENVVAGLEV